MKASKVLNLFSYIALVILLISSVNKVTATPPSYTDSQGVTYTYSGSTASVTGFTGSGDVIIPDSIKFPGTSYTVTSIVASAFQYSTNLTSVIIPSSVTSIVDEAFWGCTSLTSVSISSSVTSIGVRAFYFCSSLTSIIIPNSVTSIGSSAFQNCYALGSVTIPSSVTSIQDQAFYYCLSLTSVNIPNSVTSIGDRAFSYCYSLTSVTIPSSVVSIGASAFDSCIGMNSVTFDGFYGPTIFDSTSFQNISHLVLGYYPARRLAGYSNVYLQLMES